MRYVALLRGVNVGGRTIKSAELVKCFEGLGFTNVKSVLQSGNVIFESSEPDSAKLKSEVEVALQTTFNYPAKAQIVSIDNLQQIIANYPFGTAGESQHDYVIFMESDLEKEITKEPCQLQAGEKVAAGQGVVYWRIDKGQTLKSNFAKLLTKAKYKSFNTNRNLRTLRKLT